MKKLLIALFIVSFLILGCGGDDDNHTPPQPPPVECNYTYSECKEGGMREVLSVSPSGCTGEPILTCEYIPPVIPDCCPDQANVLRCGSCLPDRPCLTENPDIFLYCTADIYPEPSWHLRIGWGAVYVDVTEPDLSCCPWQNTGICYEECNRLSMCQTLYGTDPTEWYIFGDQGGYWYVFSNRTYQSYRIYVNE